jgi:hypothetical protein
MTNRQMTGKGLEILFPEHLCNKAEVGVKSKLVAIASRDSSALLTAMLERVQSKVCRPGNVGTRRIYSEYATLVHGCVAAPARIGI